MHPQLDEIVSEFNSASTRLRALNATLAPGAWARRPAPESWSPGECVAHLNLTAIGMLPLLRTGLDDARRIGRPAARHYRRDLVGWLLWRTISSHGRFKAKTIPAFVPSSDRREEIMAEFDRLQAEQIAIAREADGLPIDRVKMTSPFNAQVRYNIFAALSILPRHQHRHLWQAEQAIRETAEAKPR